MKVTELVYFFYPTSLLRAEGYVEIWKSRERDYFKSLTLVAFPIIASLMLMQLYFIDIPLHLKPENLWISFRTSSALLCIMCAIYSWSKFYNKFFYYKLPHAITICVILAHQYLGFLNEPRVPWIFATIIPLLCVLVLQLPLLTSVASVSIIFYAQTSGVVSSLGSTNIRITQDLVSSYFAAVVVLVLLKANDYYKVKAFLEEQKSIKLHLKVISAQKELSNQLSHFLPEVLFKRIVEFKAKNRVDYNYATQEVLKPRVKRVCCVWTDLRKFTEISKGLSHEFIAKVIPNIKLLSKVANDNHGVTRLIGDLILVYFDDDDHKKNTENALKTARDFLLKTKIGKYSSDGGLTALNRNVIVSSGLAFVGNIGSDTCREITILGEPVNKASRIDELFSKGKLSAENFKESIIVTGEVISDIWSTEMPVGFKEFDLESYGVKIRNFEGEKKLFSIDPNSLIKLSSAKYGVEDVRDLNDELFEEDNKREAA